MTSFPGPVPQEALDYFRHKGLQPGFDYRDVWRQEHAAAFTVAKATQLDVLQSIRDEVEKAIENGTTLAQFQKDLTPTLQKLGWWGRQQMRDPLTGETIEAQLGSPRRLKTIYRANLRTAYAAGQYQRAQRTKRALPYFRYSLGPSKDHRDEHVAIDGTILPVDHDFWSTHMPPNGWGCKCRVRQVSQVEMDRRGWQVSDAPQVKHRQWVNTRTGEIELVPEGIDPGWDTNPGLTRLESVNNLLVGKLETADPVVAQTALRDLVGSPLFEGWIKHPEGIFPVMRLTPQVAEAIGAKRSVAVLSDETLRKNRNHHPELTLADYRMLPAIGTDPDLVVQDGEQTVVLIKRDERIFWAAIKATATGRQTFMTSFRLASKDGVKSLIKKGKVLYGQWPK